MENVQSVPLDLPATVPGPVTAQSHIPTQRFALSRARLRAVTPLDIVTFVSACPGCGRDAEWTEERQDTRLLASIDCSCDPHPPTD